MVSFAPLKHRDEGTACLIGIGKPVGGRAKEGLPVAKTSPVTRCTNPSRRGASFQPQATAAISTAGGEAIALSPARASPASAGLSTDILRVAPVSPPNATSHGVSLCTLKADRDGEALSASSIAWAAICSGSTRGEVGGAFVQTKGGRLAPFSASAYDCRSIKGGLGGLGAGRLRASLAPPTSSLTSTPAPSL